MAFLLLASFAALPGAAQPADSASTSRLALVIGNGAYEVGRLPNPVNDANDMAATLRELDFDVILKKDVGHQEMEEAIRSFGQRLRRGGVGLFYFAGHGVQVGGDNYLIPVRSGIRLQAEVKFKAVPLGFVLGWMGDSVAEDRLNIVVLDACRNNPFPAGDRSPSRGLAATRAPVGTLIAYAAAPGAVAEDGGPGERNGRFTKHLLRALEVPDLTIEQIVKRTREAVVAETARGQVPWSESSLVGDFVPRPAVRETTATTPESAPDPEIVREAAVGELKVTVNQGGAEVRVGSLFEETTQQPETLTFRNVPIGEYRVEVRKKGFETSRQPVRIEPGMTATLSAWLEHKPRRPGELLVEKIAGVDFAQRYIPKGSFRMGSPDGPNGEPGRDDDETLHDVTLTRSFWMLETEVTQGQWERLMGNNPSYFKSCGAGCPVERVSWYDAVAFANKLSEQAGVEACYALQCIGKAGEEGFTCTKAQLTKLDCPGWRLPTEAEWEYAARAGTQGPFWTGDDLTTKQANYVGNYPYDGNPKREYRRRPVPVRRFDENPWGLYEVHGNVWEWVWDFQGNYPTGSVSDPVGPPSRSTRVLRGGSWNALARYCRSANRLARDPAGRFDYAGFRLVRTASE